MANRTLTDTATIAWDEATAAQVKGNVVDDSITNAKLANMAQATIKGRAAAAGTGDPTDLTATQVATIVDSFFLTPAEGNAAYQPLRAALTAYPDPTANDADALGTPTASWSDLYLASGGIIGWNNGDVTITHSADRLAVAFDGTDQILISKTQDQLANVFQETGETDKFAGVIFRSADPGSHTPHQHFPVHIEARPVGSGTNGPMYADYGLSVSAIKHNVLLGTAAATGEVDGITIAVRQGGTLSDCACLLGNIAHTGTGFICFQEAVVALEPAPTFVQTHSQQIQIGSINTPTGQAIGFNAHANKGALTEAFRCDTTLGGSWNYLFRGCQLGVDRFTIGGDGNATSYRNDANVLTPHFIAEQDGTGDASIQWLLSSTQAWTAGIDNSDSDAWKLQSAGDGFATGVALRVTTGGAIQAVNPTGGLGYGTGAGSAQTQATNKATTVVINTVCGEITMNNASLGAGATIGFAVTNSAVAQGDSIIINHARGGTGGAYRVSADGIGAGGFAVRVTNTSGGALGEAIILSFAVIKSVAA